MIAMLEGFTIGITADRRADEQITHFERRGATVVHGPALRTEPLVDGDELRAATDAVLARPPAVVIANTAIGMRSWIGAAEAWGTGEALLDVLRRASVFARGAKAAGVLHGYGVPVAGRPPTERLDDCVELARPLVSAGTHVVVQRDGGPRPRASAALAGAGAEVTEVPVYRWGPATEARPAVRLARAVISGRVHAVTFTAAPALTSWFELAAAEGLADDLRARLAGGTTVIGCVGPVCAEAAEAHSLGRGDLVMPRTFRLGPLVRAVADRLLSKAVRVGDLLITGTVVRTASRQVELTDTEAQILTALAGRPGAVLAKADLLRDVWGDADGDPHLVEVAVGRLRRRLGPDGRSIVAVPRRGYTLREAVR